VLRKVFGPWSEGVRGNWRKLLVRSFRFILLSNCYSGDQMKVNGMGRECGTYRGEEKYVQREVRGKRRFAYLSVDGAIILKYVFEK
jgi:hypothetical protein